MVGIGFVGFSEEGCVSISGWYEQWVWRLGSRDNDRPSNAIDVLNSDSLVAEWESLVRCRAPW